MQFDEVNNGYTQISQTEIIGPAWLSMEEEKAKG
jgi:hypothetical protein